MFLLSFLYNICPQDRDRQLNRVVSTTNFSSDSLSFSNLTFTPPNVGSSTAESKVTTTGGVSGLILTLTGADFVPLRDTE